jgi:hypothetical protein
MSSMHLLERQHVHYTALQHGQRPHVLTLLWYNPGGYAGCNLMVINDCTRFVISSAIVGPVLSSSSPTQLTWQVYTCVDYTIHPSRTPGHLADATRSRRGVVKVTLTQCYCTILLACRLAA